MNYAYMGWNVIGGIKKTQKIYKLMKKYKHINRGNNNMDLTSRKERSDMILEPLQVMVQLALLSQSPIGTKVSVSDNILRLHPPSYLQGVWRWYNSDGKDDLYYLFHAIRRYYKWYKDRDDQVFTKILSLAIKGIGKLTETYNKVGITTITHTLNLYKNILEQDSKELFKDETEQSISIDTVFEKITNIYDRRLLIIIYSTFEIMNDEENKQNLQKYIKGLNNMLNPTETKIRKWILDNLTC